VILKRVLAVALGAVQHEYKLGSRVSLLHIRHWEADETALNTLTESSA